MRAIFLAAIPAAMITSPAAAAQPAPFNDPAPGASALMSTDYASAVREIRAAPVSPYDPARSLNLGIALAKSGDTAAAAKAFQSVLMEDDVEFVVANGQTAMSHDVARRALAALQAGDLSR